jgi:flagellar hook-length control protein FliK
MPPASGAAPSHARATTRVLPEAAAGRGLRSTDEASAVAASLSTAAAAKETAPKAERGADVTLPLAALAAAPSGEAPRGAAAKPAWQAEVHAAVGSGEFAPALGTQLRVMVRDGIEHAQLKLNPADLGPIEVRIDLQGAQAQVDFSAAHAATRQALQEAVPALASALRESGLTLTGGGVFDQPREQRGEARQEGARPGTAPSAGAGGTVRETAAPQPARLSRARGAVDLYA